MGVMWGVVNLSDARGGAHMIDMTVCVEPRGYVIEMMDDVALSQGLEECIEGPGPAGIDDDATILVMKHIGVDGERAILMMKSDAPEAIFDEGGRSPWAASILGSFGVHGKPVKALEKKGMKRSKQPLKVMMACLVMWAVGGCTFNPPAYVNGENKDMNNVQLDMLFPPKDMAKDERPDSQPQDQTVDLEVDAGRDQTGDQATDQTMDQTGVDQSMDMVTEDMPTQMFMMCDGSRVDVLSDNANCGQCGNACDGTFGVCRAGRCECVNADMLACGDSRRCEEIKIDANNCGQCDFKCGPGSSCINGACKCRAGFTECNGECVDTLADSRHCGQCNNSCMGNACRGGQCRGKNECELFEGSCNRYESDGRVCLSTQGMENDLYCRNGADFGCGDRCRGDQFCDKLDLLQPRRCYRYRPGRGCDSCPCADCSNDEVCRSAIGVSRKVYCVRK